MVYVSRGRLYDAERGKGERMKVQCPNCKKICHETTESYDPAIRPNGAMVRLLDPWKTWGWGKFGDHRNGGAEVIASDMECPCCEAPLAPSGRLRVVSEDHGKTEAEKTARRKLLAAGFKYSRNPPPGAPRGCSRHPSPFRRGWSKDGVYYGLTALEALREWQRSTK
jgi:hypothetical protein